MSIASRITTTQVAILVSLAAVVAGSDVTAEPRKKVLVLPFEGDLDKKAPADGLARLTAVVARSAGITGADVSIGQASYTDTADLIGCGGTGVECLAQIADALKVDQVVTGAVEASGDGSVLTVNLEFFKDGQVHEKTLELAAPSFEAVLAGLARDVPDLFVSAPDARPAPEPVPEPEPAPAKTASAPEEVPPAAVVAPAPVERDSGFDAGRVGVIAWGLAGLGVAAGAGGAAFLYLARDRQKQVDNAPISSVTDFDRLEKLEDEGERFTRFGNGLLIGGGAALLVGGALIAIQGLSGGGDEGDRSSVAIAPMPLPGGAGINLSFESP